MFISGYHAAECRRSHLLSDTHEAMAKHRQSNWVYYIGTDLLPVAVSDFEINMLWQNGGFTRVIDNNGLRFVDDHGWA